MTYLLNLLDLALTLYALSIGCTELNPLMQSVPVLVAYKVIITGGLLWWMSGRTELARECVAETREALQAVYNDLNHGQRKKLLRNHSIRAMFEQYGV